MKIPYSFIQKCNDLSVDISTCTLTAYHAFSLHLQDVYIDTELTTKLKNPIKLNALNLLNVNLSSSPYRLILTDDKNKQILDDFNVVGVPNESISSISFDSVRDSTGSTQFSASSINKSLMFASSGAISLSFDNILNKITISGGSPQYLTGTGIKITTNTLSIGNIANGSLLIGAGSNNDANILNPGVQYSILVMGGGGLPVWGTVNLNSSSSVSGILPISSGGTGLSVLGPLGIAILSYSSVLSGLVSWNGSSFSINTNNYLTANQPITLSGDVSGSGATSITVSVNKILGNSVPSNAAGVLYNSGSGVLSWVTGLPPSGVVSGDLSGSLPNPTVTGIQGKSITLATGLLKYNGTTWIFDNTSYLTNSAISGISNRIAIYTGTNSIGSNSGYSVDLSLQTLTASVATIGSWSNFAAYARFGHSSFNSTSGFGYLHSDTGEIYFDAGASTSIRFRIDSVETMRITGLHLNMASGADIQLNGTVAITSARAGNLTALIVGSSTGFVRSASGVYSAAPLTSGDVTGALGYTPVSGGPFLPISGGTETGTVVFAAGSATLAPISFQTGSLLTTAVAHSVEWNGSNLYITTSTPTRKQIAYIDSTMTGLWNGTPIGVTYGGTNISSYSIGDILYANTTSSLAKLNVSISGNALISGTTPSWGKIGLTSHVSGILPVSNGGTGLSSLGSLGLAVLSYSNVSAGVLRWSGSSYSIDTTLSNGPYLPLIAGATYPLSSTLYANAGIRAGTNLILQDLVGASGFGAVYGTGAAPSSTNYMMAAQADASEVYFNATSKAAIDINGVDIVLATASGVTLTGVVKIPDVAASKMLKTDGINDISAATAGIDYLDTTAISGTVDQVAIFSGVNSATSNGGLSVGSTGGKTFLLQVGSGGTSPSTVQILRLSGVTSGENRIQMFTNNIQRHQIFSTVTEGLYFNEYNASGTIIDSPLGWSNGSGTAIIFGGGGRPINLTSGSSLQYNGVTVLASSVALQNLNGISSSGYITFSSLSGTGNSIVGATSAGVLFKAVAGTDYVLPSALSTYLPLAAGVGSPLTGQLYASAGLRSVGLTVVAGGAFAYTDSSYADPDSGVNRDAKFGHLGIATASLKVTGAITTALSSGFVKSTFGTLSAAALASSDVTTALGYTPVNPTAITGTSGQIALFNGSNSINSNLAFTYTLDGTTGRVQKVTLGSSAVGGPAWTQLAIAQSSNAAGGGEIYLGAAGNTGDENSGKIIFPGARIVGRTTGTDCIKFQMRNAADTAWEDLLSIQGTTGGVARVDISSGHLSLGGQPRITAAGGGLLSALTVGSSTGFVRSAAGVYSASSLSSGDVTGALGYTPVNPTAMAGTSGQIAKFTAPNAVSGSAALSFDGINVAVGDGSSSITYGMDINGPANGYKRVRFLSGGAASWILQSGATSHQFLLEAYNLGTFVDRPLTIVNGAGGIIAIGGDGRAVRLTVNSKLTLADATTDRWSTYISGTQYRLQALDSASASIDHPLVIDNAVGGTILLGGGGRPINLSSGSRLQINGANAIDSARVANFNGLTSSGSITFSAFGAGFVRSDASGQLFSSTLASGDVTGALGYTPVNPAAISGTTGTLAKWTGASTLGNSLLAESGANVTSFGNIRIDKASPSMTLRESSAGTDVKVWQWASTGGAFTLYAFNDAESIGQGVISFSRSGINPTNLLINPTQVDITSLNGGGFVRAAGGTGRLSASALTSGDVTTALGYAPVSGGPYLPTAGGVMANNAMIQFNQTTGTYTSAGGVWGQVGDNDWWGIRGGSTAVDAGYLEIATGDNANTTSEPIYIRQYYGANTTTNWGTVQRTLTLLDGSGNTSIPGQLAVNGTLFRDRTDGTVQSCIYMPSISGGINANNYSLMAHKSGTYTAINASSWVGLEINNQDILLAHSDRVDSSVPLNVIGPVAATTAKLGVQFTDGSSRLLDLSPFWVVPSSQYVDVKLPSTPSVGCAFCIFRIGGGGRTLTVSSISSNIATSYSSTTASLSLHSNNDNLNGVNSNDRNLILVWTGSVWMGYNDGSF